jgi:hypothetical protein
MVKLWDSLTELQRMELIGFAQGIAGREPNSGINPDSG